MKVSVTDLELPSEAQQSRDGEPGGVSQSQQSTGQNAAVVNAAKGPISLTKDPTPPIQELRPDATQGESSALTLAGDQNFYRFWIFNHQERLTKANSAPLGCVIAS